MRSRGSSAARLRQVAEALIPASRVVYRLRRDARRQERRAAREVEAALRDLGRHVVKVTADQGGLIVDTAEAHREPVPGLQEGQLVVEASRREAQRINAIIRAAKLRDWRKGKLGPVLKRIWERVTGSTIETMEAAGVEVSNRDRIQQRVLQTGGRRLGMIDIEAQTKAALFRTLDKARAEGLSPIEVAREMRWQVPAGPFPHAGPKYRAELIARTEILHSQRTASSAAYRQDPLINRVIAFDGDKDAECAARNGRTYTLDQADEEIAATHPNCVLAFGPVV